MLLYYNNFRQTANPLLHLYKYEIEKPITYDMFMSLPLRRYNSMIDI